MTDKRYGKAPVDLGKFGVELSEVMRYLYLPIRMRDVSDRLRLPPSLAPLYQMVYRAENTTRDYKYTYISASKGWATRDNPLNRPGWHCDGFGSDDMNFVWWIGPGTRFALQEFHYISEDHAESMEQFSNQVHTIVTNYPEKHLYALDPYVVHATPLIKDGCMRQYVKISLSDSEYNLEDNSHNYLFSYEWPLSKRTAVRNDPCTQKEFV